MYTIIPFEPSYRDDVIFCLLCAKDALGRAPRLNEDLLDIEKNYFGRGDMFWIALDERGRVSGMIGTNIVSETDMWLKRLYIRPTMKRRGLGGALLAKAEGFARSKGIKTIHTRFADDYLEAAEFYPAKGFVESERVKGLRHLVKSID